MRTFEIVSSKGRRKSPVGWLTYDEDAGEATIKLASTAQVGHVPAMFSRFIELGEDRIDSTWTLKWIQERIPPQSRHNIDAILAALGLDEYDPYALLFAAQGRSAQDDFFLREVKSTARPPKGSYEYALVQLKSSVGEDLLLARQEADMTQQQLAHRSGIQQSMLSRIENGKANPTIETLECLASTLGLELTISFG